MAISPYVGRARRARLFKQNSVFWGVVGRYDVWPNGDITVDPELTDTSIYQPLLFVQPELISLCKVVTSNEDVIHLGTKYRFIADEDAITEASHFIYLRVRFNPALNEDMGVPPKDSFRQVGIYTDLIPAGGFENATFLLPEQVVDVGVLEYVDNDVKTMITRTRIDVIEIVIECR
jgi:hypothetical protein